MMTAVEFLTNELLYLDNEFDMGFIDKNEYQSRRKEAIEKARGMEREQIELAHIDGGKNERTAVKYYRDTFKIKEYGKEHK